MSKFKLELLPGSKRPVNKKGILQCYAYEDGVVQPQCRKLINMGIRVEVPNDHCVLVLGHSIKSLGGVGDSDYRGVYSVIGVNDTSVPFVYNKGDHIGNICLLQICTPDIEVVEQY